MRGYEHRCATVAGEVPVAAQAIGNAALIHALFEQPERIQHVFIASTIRAYARMNGIALTMLRESGKQGRTAP
jgi:hypothetical protein